MNAPARSYLVCALPRSGGRVLADSLRATGAVTAPDPRFWWGWAGHDPVVRHRLRPDADPTVPDTLLGRIRADGTDAAGVFGAEVQWAELDGLLAALHRPAPDRPRSAGPRGARRPPCTGRVEHELLEAYLPGLRYVHLTREDKAAQALAWWRTRRAVDDVDRPCGPGPSGQGTVLGDEPFPCLADGPDTAAIDELERRLRADEWRWVSFFARAGVEPLVVSYEALFADHTTTVHRVLEYLEVPAARSIAVGPPSDPLGERVDRAQVADVRRRRRRATDDSFAENASVSVVITGHGPGSDLGAVAREVRLTVPDDVEIVVVDDRPAPVADEHASPLVPGALVVRPPAPAGPAAARNYGAGRTRGQVLVFLDAGVHPFPGWLGPLRTALAGPGVAVAGAAVVDLSGDAPTAFGLTWGDPLLGARRLERHPGGAGPTPVPFVAGCCMAFRRRDFEAVGGFDIGMIAAGSEDAEICLHLWRRGRRCLVVPAAEVAHERPGAPADDGATADAALFDALRLATMHFGPDTMLRTFDEASDRDGFAAVYQRLVSSDVFERRRRVVASSTRDDTWFVDRFDIEALR